jgi:hypothetical protein
MKFSFAWTRANIVCNIHSGFLLVTQKSWSIFNDFADQGASAMEGFIVRLVCTIFRSDGARDSALGQSLAWSAMHDNRNVGRDPWLPCILQTRVESTAPACV